MFGLALYTVVLSTYLLFLFPVKWPV